MRFRMNAVATNKSTGPEGNCSVSTCRRSAWETKHVRAALKGQRKKTDRADSHKPADQNVAGVSSGL